MSVYNKDNWDKDDFEFINNLIENTHKYKISKNELNLIDWENRVEYSNIMTDQDQLYLLYSEFRDKIHNFSNIADIFSVFSGQISEYTSENYNTFLKTLNKSVSLKNKSNMYILLSITSQILSLIFLLMLFKRIIFLDKNRKK